MSIPRNLLAASTAVALAALTTDHVKIPIRFAPVVAQPDGPGSRGPGPGEPGMMMGPGKMHERMYRRICSPDAAGFAEWRINRVEQLIKPTDAQRAKFEAFKAASSKAADTLRAA